MSNPGVITLTEKEISASKTFRVEDNLGESIHFHYNDIRIDLTIPELLYIADICDDTIYDLVGADNFNLDDFDGNFLNEYSQYLIDLKEVKSDKVSVKDIYYQSKGFLNLPVRKHLNSSNAKKLAEKQLKYENRSYHAGKRKKYKAVMFNDNNTLMYGKRQAARLYLEDPNGEIEVLRLMFDKGKYSVSNHPWIPFLFKWDKKRFINVAKKTATKILK